MRPEPTVNGVHIRFKTCFIEIEISFLDWTIHRKKSVHYYVAFVVLLPLN